MLMKMMPSDCHFDWERIEPASRSYIHTSLNLTRPTSTSNQVMDHQRAGISQEGAPTVRPQSTAEVRGCDSAVTHEDSLPGVMECAPGLEGDNVEDLRSPPCKKLHTRIPDDEEACAEYFKRSCTVAAPPPGEEGAKSAGPDNLSHGSPDDLSQGLTDDLPHRHDDDVSHGSATVKELLSNPQSGFHSNHGNAVVGNSHVEIPDREEDPGGSPSSFDCAGSAPKFPIEKDFSKEKVSVQYCASPYCRPVSSSTDENQNVTCESHPKTCVSDCVATTTASKTDGCFSTQREIQVAPKNVSSTNAASGHDQAQSDCALERHLRETISNLPFEQLQSGLDHSPSSANELYDQAESGLEPHSPRGDGSPLPNVPQPSTHSNEDGDSLTASECQPETHSSEDISSRLLEQTQSGFSLELHSEGHIDNLSSDGLQSSEDVDSFSSPVAFGPADTQSGLSLESQSIRESNSLSLSSAVTHEPGREDHCRDPEHSSSVSSVVTSAGVDCIPDELLLKFFAFLSPAELCRHVTTVCKRWHRLAYDSTLWRRLDLSTWRMNGPQLHQIVLRVPGAIKYLDMSGLDNLTNQEMAAVAGNCPDLTYLDMGFVDDLNSTMMQAILTSCPKLQFINVEGCRNANNEMMRVIAASAGPMIRRLNFSHCPIVDESLSLMMKHIPCITHLNIDGISWISELVVQHLASKYFDTFESLELDGNELSDNTIFFVSFCHRLKTLSVSFCERLTDLSVKYLLRLEHLVKLVLRKGANFSAVAMMEFFSTSTVQNLTYLDLTECQQLEDEGVKAISQTCGPSLRTLYLCWCWNITDVGMADVASSCPRMVKMYLVGLHRLEGAWLPTATVSMPNLVYISFEQCNEVQDTAIEEAVRGKPDLVILNYYGEVFVHRSLH